MLRKLSLLLVVGIVVALVPVAAVAGNGVLGACWVYNPGPTAPEGVTPEFAACADDFTEELCNRISELVNFAPGDTCADMAGELRIEWNGSCLADFPLEDDICVQLWSALGAQGSQGLCTQEIGGSWFTDLECGGTPVPTVPPIGLAALASLMLAAALVVLSLRGSRTVV